MKVKLFSKYDPLGKKGEIQLDFQNEINDWLEKNPSIKPESVKPGRTFPYISYLRPVILECVEAVEDFHPGGENAF